MARSYSFDKGPKADGKGQAKVNEVSWEESVEGQAASSVPGGESKKGSQIDIEGPNAYKNK
jgi:hypothetical protein